MKKYLILFASLFFLSGKAQDVAQQKLEIDPVTNCALRYYYFPNMEAYYDLKEGVYRYQQDKIWRVDVALPPNYGGYSLFKNERVIITDFEDDTPEQFIKVHRKEFPYNPKGRIKRPLQSMVPNSDALSLIE
ncbi:hypothetical protein [Flavobacterium sp. XGLA_31]|uniref:hypothetical protein n=1 Tax=Flavobacterium sp. XGLA_31 TaxID=3447666 RepID=UPI003F2B8EEC